MPFFAEHSYIMQTKVLLYEQEQQS